MARIVEMDDCNIDVAIHQFANKKYWIVYTDVNSCEIVLWTWIARTDALRLIALGMETLPTDQYGPAGQPI